MSSSISSSNPLAWQRWLRLWLSAAAGGVLSLFLLVALVDPWDALPLSPPLPRVPISSNARYSFPALARSPRFDAAIFGTSTTRLLRPAALDPLFGGARFVNLAMNSATAYEQARLLQVFLRAHPHPEAVLVGLDQAWCVPKLERYTPRPFPEWMYEPGARWAGYREALQPYAVQEAVSELATMLGLKRRRYGLDGYTRFVPPDSDYDPARVDRAFLRWPLPDAAPAPIDWSPPPLPALDLLRDALASLPPGTRALLFFAPINIEQQGVPGSATARNWAACKAGAAAVARAAGAELRDFLIASPITGTRANYWDPLHYREAIAQRLAEDLGTGVREGEDWVRLAP
jgi:hypothetical protein